MADGRSLQYSGENINDIEVAGNDLDYAGSSLLYDSELSREMTLDMRLKRLNATVYATDKSIQSTALETTRDLNYTLYAHTTGQADLSYRKSGTAFSTERGSYDIASGADGGYYGDYTISRRMRMHSEFIDHSVPQSRLPCCAGGWTDLPPIDQKGHSAEGIFSCRC